METMGSFRVYFILFQCSYYTDAYAHLMPDTDMLQILKPLLAVEHLSSSFSSVTLSHFCFDFQIFKFLLAKAWGGRLT